MLVEIMIAQICGGLPNVDFQACTKALEASSMQCYVKQDVDRSEKIMADFAYKKSSSVIGEFTVGASVALAKAFRDRTLSYTVIKNANGIMPSVTPAVDPHGARVQLNWKF